MNIQALACLSFLSFSCSVAQEASESFDGAMCSTGSLTCSLCPGCIKAECGLEAIQLPPKSPFWPPEDILQRGGGPAVIPANHTAEYAWFTKTVIDALPSSVKQQDTPYALTEDETKLVKMELVEWQEARKAGTYSCEDMSIALIKRAKYMQSIQKMNSFMYWGDSLNKNMVAESRNIDIEEFDWTEVVMEQSKKLDDKAAIEGVESIAPLYCYPIPAKGTMVTKDFPSSSGFAMLQDKFGVIDADLITLMKNANAIIFGKTNVPELAHSWGTGNYVNGLAFNPWDHNMMTGGSSGGSGAAVASYTAAIAITEDTSGSTNTPAARNHLFGYDPPKFHYPNNGNPSLTYRNDQLGVNARSIDDIIAFDMGVLDTADAHAVAKAKVDAMSNSDIVIGCSNVYYNYTTATDAIKSKYNKVVQVLKDAGYSFVDECQNDNPMDEVTPPEGMSRSAVWFEEMENFIKNGLGLPDMNPWDVLLNGYYDFGQTLSMSWMFGYQDVGCDLINKNSEEARAEFMGPIPAARSDVYNKYFDTNSVDLMMGPSQYCDRVLWTDDIGGGAGINSGCDSANGGRSTGGCMFNCHSPGVLGTRDKTFTKAKFIVPVGLTSVDEPFTIQFMSRAGPRDATVPASEWVYDEEGPKTWNLKELYMVKRISETLASAGMERADAILNEITGLMDETGEEPSGGASTSPKFFIFAKICYIFTIFVVFFCI